MKTFTTIAIFVIIAGAVVFFLTRGSSQTREDGQGANVATTTSESDVATSTQAEAEEAGVFTIGQSIEGRDIVVHRFVSPGFESADAADNTELLFVGGIHGGYSWNTALLAYELIDYLEANPAIIPDNVTVAIIPVLNPDGLNEVTGTDGRFTPPDVSSSDDVQAAGRFNANDVDLNRNFDCDWQPTGRWQRREVSGGDEAFSEPESRAVRDYVSAHTPAAVVVWYSAAGGVFSSSCNEGVLDETRALTRLFAEASGYPSFEEFDFYEITGDMTNWLAKEGVPATSVLLTTRKDVEWEKNKKGVEALLDTFAQ